MYIIHIIYELTVHTDGEGISELYFMEHWVVCLACDDHPVVFAGDRQHHRCSGHVTAVGHLVTTKCNAIEKHSIILNNIKNE